VYAEVGRQGRWNTALLFKAARILGREAKLDLEGVKERLEDIKRLVGSMKSR